MNVIFLEDVPNKAHAGEVVKVADGYARNYLLPKGLAEIVTPEIMKRVHKIRAEGDTRRIKETEAMEELAQLLDNTKVSISARVTPTGRYYGAISHQMIAEELSNTLGRDIDRRLVEVIEPIREPGEHEITLRLSSDVEATIYINAEPEE